MNTHRMTCGEAREKLPLYVGGDLDPDVLDCVRGHLEVCEECARRNGEAVRARRALVGALRARETGPGRPALWSGIRSTLRAEGLVHEARAPVPVPVPAAPVRARAPRWTWALVPAVAAAAVLAVVQWSGIGSRVPGGERQPELAGPRPRGADARLGGAEVVTTPVGLPADATLALPAGSLRRVDPREAILPPALYRRPLRRGEGSAPSPHDISLTGLNGFK